MSIYKVNGKIVKASNEIAAIKKFKDERLSPMTYSKLKELGYSSDDWANWTQEQANEIIHKNDGKGGNKKSKEVSESKQIDLDKSFDTYNSDELNKVFTALGFKPDNIEKSDSKYSGNKLIFSDKDKVDTLKNAFEKAGIYYSGAGYSFNFEKGDYDYTFTLGKEPLTNMKKIAEILPNAEKDNTNKKNSYLSSSKLDTVEKELQKIDKNIEYIGTMTDFDTDEVAGFGDTTKETAEKIEEFFKGKGLNATIENVNGEYTCFVKVK